ncbi:MAG: UrcA family protein [Blastomonas sp.]|nr:UrcA family protein [Blastomonas sp.]
MSDICCVLVERGARIGAPCPIQMMSPMLHSSPGRTSAANDNKAGPEGTLADRTGPTVQFAPKKGPHPMFARALAPVATRALAAAAASAIIFSASVQANPVKTSEAAGGRVVRSVEVPFVDLDLTTPAGAATLQARLKTASRQVCGTPETPTLRERIDYRNCVSETIASGQRAMVTLIARAEAGERFKPGERIAVGS